MKILKNRLKLIIIAVNVVVVLAAIGIAAFIFLGGEKEEKPVEIVSHVHDPGDPFLTNIAGSTKFLKADLTLEYMAPLVEEEEAEGGGHGGEGAIAPLGHMSNSEVRDIIILTLRSFSAADLMDPTAQKTVKKELIEELNKHMDEGIEVVNIFFDEFIAT